MARNLVISEGDQEAKWIHRDKLTQIEIQEYIERGMQPPAELLHRAAQRGESTRSRQAKYPVDQQNNSSHENKRQRIQSPDIPDSPIGYDDYDENDEPFVPEDPRSPEEIASDYAADEANDIHIMGKLRASSSKIPLATSSPLPVPLQHLERDTPLRRKRETSEEYDDEYTPQLRMRSRGNSFGSQVLLDDDAYNTLSSSPTKNITKTQPKVRAPSNNNKIINSKQRTSSASARVVSAKRPGTSGCINDRPRTAINRPEGDPPWIDQMYKPDPMLPPDQQVIPTHAKRMMAERWEREGKTGSIYDRELTPVQIYDESRAPSSQANGVQQEDQHHENHRNHQSQQTQQNQHSPPVSQFEPSNNSAWPLKPQGPVDVPRSPNPNAGYSTMPKLQKSPSVGPLPSPRIDSRPFEQQQLQLEPEKEKKEKGGCGCCVVM